MAKYIVQRLILAIPVIIIVTVGVFILVRVIPGDVAALRLGAQATPEQLDQFREQHGLLRPLPIQYGDWVWGAIRGDLDRSLWEGRAVTTVIIEKFPVTMELAILSVILSAAIGVPLGVLSAVKQDTWVDQLVRFVAVLFLAIPAFWLAILIITFPSIWWSWTPPTSGWTHLWENPATNLWRIFWPAMVISASSVALILRLTRSSMLEVLRQDFIRTARSKGLADRIVLYRHALKNALIPVVTVLGLQLSVLLGGAVIVEQVFAIPGMGRSMLQAVFQRDYPLIQGYVLVFATVYVLMNLLVDVAYSYLDPRIRY
ncbi:MAG: ABC transporter permease [Dehalococcoidia bacterium]